MWGGDEKCSSTRDGIRETTRHSDEGGGEEAGCISDWPWSARPWSQCYIVGEVDGGLA